MTWIAGILLCTTIIGAVGTLYYRSQFLQSKSLYQELLIELEDFTITVDLKLDYGENKVEWYNDTRIPVGASLLNATLIVADIEYSVTEFGVLVNSINGIEGDSNNFWLWDYYENGEWKFGPVGADQWTLENGDIVSWSYSSF
jgi:hypothetical protein